MGFLKNKIYFVILVLLPLNNGVLGSFPNINSYPYHPSLPGDIHIPGEIRKFVDIDRLAHEIKEDAQKYLNVILTSIREQMYVLGLDTIQLPEFKEDFQQIWSDIKLQGEASFFNGYIQGFNEFTKSIKGDNVSIASNGDLLISTKISVDHALVGYGMKVAIMRLETHSNVAGTLSNLKIKTVLRVNANNIRRVSVEKFELESLGTLSCEIAGLGQYFEQFNEKIVRCVGDVVNKVLTHLIEKPVKEMFTKFVASTPYPTSSSELLSNFKAMVANYQRNEFNYDNYI